MSFSTIPGALDEAARGYLQQVTSGQAPISEGVVALLRGPGVWLGVAGGLALCSAGLFALTREPVVFGSPAWLLVPGGLLVAGLALVVAYAYTLGVRARTKQPLADALVVDLAHVWLVRTHRIEAFAHAEVRPRRLVRTTFLGRPRGARLEFEVPAGSRSIAIADARLAVRVWAQLQHVAELRARPAGRRYLERVAATLPAPGRSASSPLVTRTRLVVAVALVAAVAAAVLLPLATSAIAERWLGQALLESPAGRVDVAQRYLERCPRGEHAAEARQRLDDQAYAVAYAARSVRQLRGYLADPANTRHRAEATRALAALYDDAERRLAASQLQTEYPDFAWALSSLLARARSSSSADVAVVLDHGFVPAPTSAWGRRREWQRVASFTRRSAALSQRVGFEGRGAAIVPPGDAFHPSSFVVWDALALRRLNLGIADLLGGDVLDFVPAEHGAGALTVHYQLFPTGGLESCVGMADASALAIVRSDRGAQAEQLVREYAVRWRLSVPVRGQNTSYEFTTLTRPGSELRYLAAPGDPQWAPTAIVIQSAIANLETALADAGTVGGTRTETAFRFAGFATAE